MYPIIKKTQTREVQRVKKLKAELPFTVPAESRVINLNNNVAHQKTLTTNG